MYQIIRTAARPSIDIEFFKVSDIDDVSNHFMTYWVETYRHTDKLLLLVQEHSDDQLTMTTTFIWDSEETCNDVYADPVVSNYWAIRDAYNTENGVTFSEVRNTL
jgi:hypothetical protein